MKRVINSEKLPVKLWLDDIEDSAELQVKNLANLPFIHKHVAVMPDAHAGKGSTVGSVIATKGAIIPAAIGCDIGCGVVAVKLPFSIDVILNDKSLRTLRNSIERSIPVGNKSNYKITDRVGKVMTNLTDIIKNNSPIGIDVRSEKKPALQIGTLGGGNHFIEICVDTKSGVWVVLHSGSRNIGKRLADVHINGAKDLMKQYFIDLPDPDLAYLVQGTKEFNHYIHDVLWAQQYAKENRNEMMLRVLKDISYHVYGEDIGLGIEPGICPLRVDCHHNYTQMENHFGKNIWVTRKGAVSAREGQLGIIPGSMGTKSYIVEGLGNVDSFCSCSHGAGRQMSRTQARKEFTKDDFAKQTEGVECRKDEGVLDEIPGAYKSIDKVMENQKDLVKPIYELKQILCVKG